MSLEEKLFQFREKYYKENKKATIFKNSQKLACAEEITKSFSVDELLNTSIYANQYKIMVDYPLIKTFINPTIYTNILQHVEYLTQNILLQYSHFEIHLNIQSFTMTAAQRYNELIKDFCNIYLNSQYEEKLKHIYIMNPPNIITILQTMFHPFISESAKDKVVILK